MSADPSSEAEELERFRAYLHLLARARLDPRLQAKLDPSDIVQQTLLEALQALKGFQRRSREEMGGWVRPVLARHPANAPPHLRPGHGGRARGAGAGRTAG